MSTCYGGTFIAAPLGVDVGYAGPNITEVQQAGPCWCNTVTYSLASACSECQGGESIEWSQYEEYCTTVLAPSTFPNPVPAGTRVQHWALVAISGPALWSPSTAQIVGDAPEIIPGELIDTPAVVPTPSHTVVPTTSFTFTTPTIVRPEPTITVPSSGGNGGDTGPGSLTNGSNQGAGVGGVLRGVVIMAAIAGLTLTLIL